ncbi:MAG TPA: methyltransferase domain-containing protein [Gemmatimonadaceae bacterium]|nr:methyltransferase domain-containing protein [Gemmatimonadaceae bacterium]
MLTPRRRRGIEILDDPAVDPEVRRRSIGDVTRSNRWLGGLRAAALELRDALRGLGSATLLDVGTGLADIPARARRAAERDGTALTIIGVDEARSLLAAARGRLDAGVCADALALPFRNRSIDVVMCSQVLHHFENADAERLLREMSRVARRAVIVCDLRRSWLAAAGFWLVSFPLRFHPVTRHDGVVSVLRGFTADELDRLVHAASGVHPRLRRRLGYRITARWSPANA